jgi:hypothetical protein
MLLLGCLSCWLVIKLSRAPLIFPGHTLESSAYNTFLAIRACWRQMRAITTRAGG